MNTPLLLEAQQSTTPLASRQSFRRPTGRLERHESKLELLVASQPLRMEDVVYPSNIALGGDDSGLPDFLDQLAGQKSAALVTMAVFAGYACLFSLQHMLKVFLNIPDDDSEASHYFSFAITAMYISNLVFRLGQNVLLQWFTPRQRALLGLCAMTLSMAVLGGYVLRQENREMSAVLTAYVLGGFAIGTFETNFSVLLAALGSKTKIYGISGIPIGIFIVIVPGFVLITAGLPVMYLYASVGIFLIVAGTLLACGLRYVDHYDGGESRFSNNIQSAAAPESSAYAWIAPVVSVGIVFAVNMLFVSAFSPGVLLYLYNGPSVDLVSASVPTGYFFATFSSFGFLSDVLSRKCIYSKKPDHHPVRYLLFTGLGVSLLLSKTPLLAPIATSLVFFANGSIYAQSCRKLDELLVINPSALLVANSVFFFLGDCGSVVGALLIPFIRDQLTRSWGQS